MQSQDLLRMRWVGDVQVSPDGLRVAWVERWIDADRDAYRSCICVAAVRDGGEPRRFTSGAAEDKSPRWSPDGRWIAFLSNRRLPSASSRSGSASKDPGQDGRMPHSFQPFVMPADGGEAVPLARLRYGAGPPLWAPDGRSIAFVAPIDPERGVEVIDDDGQDEGDLYRRFNRDVRIVTRLTYKEDGVGWLDGKRRHVVLIPFEEAAVLASPDRALAAPPALVTRGDFDVLDACWAPQGGHLAIVTNPDPDADLQPWTDVYRVPAAECGPSRPPADRLTSSDLRIQSVRYSPDGRRLAFTARDLAYLWYANTHLYVQEDGRRVSLTERDDLTVGNESTSDVFGEGSTPFEWSPDGSGLYASVSRRGAVDLYWFGLDGTRRALSEGRHVLVDYSLSRTGDLAGLIWLDEEHPGDAWVARISPQGLEGERRLTNVNRALFEEVAVSVPEPFRFRADDGVEIDGWVMRPVPFEPGRRYPAVLQIHGGPMAMYAHAFFHEFQVLAARGYVVVYGNPRGSQGYGQEFCSAIRGAWGRRDYQDVLACLDEAVRRFDFIDPGRIGVAGGSYGGYMTNWIIAHTDRFKAAVTMRSVTNEYSFHGTSDIGHHDLYDLKCRPWEDPLRYLEMSPIHFAGDIRTPTLIIHSDGDMRCPIEQAEQLYVALKVRRVPVEFVRFTGESHNLSRGGKPWHRVFRIDRIVDWFDRHLQLPVEPGAPSA